MDVNECIPWRVGFYWAGGLNSPRRNAIPHATCLSATTKCNSTVQYMIVNSMQISNSIIRTDRGNHACIADQLNASYGLVKRSLMHLLSVIYIWEKGRGNRCYLRQYKTMTLQSFKDTIVHLKSVCVNCCMPLRNERMKQSSWSWTSSCLTQQALHLLVAP